MSESFLSARDVADRIGVAPKTVKEWGRQGRIPTVRLGWRTVRYDWPKVKAALSKMAKERG